MEDVPDFVKFKWKDKKNDLMNFHIIIKVLNKKSLWYGGTYYISFNIPKLYPIDKPSCHWVCSDKITKQMAGCAPIYHPNINLKGDICLNILSKDPKDGWKPIYTIENIYYGLISLLNDTCNKYDPLNKEAAALMIDNEKEFRKVVRSTMKGNSYKGQKFWKSL